MLLAPGATVDGSPKLRSPVWPKLMRGKPIWAHAPTTSRLDTPRSRIAM